MTSVHGSANKKSLLCNLDCSEAVVWPNNCTVTALPRKLYFRQFLCQKKRPGQDSFPFIDCARLVGTERTNHRGLNVLLCVSHDIRHTLTKSSGGHR